jgi:hypothetical protein
MDQLAQPYKVATSIVTYGGDWTAEQIDAGEAGDPSGIETDSAWWEPGSDGPIEVTDPARIAALDALISTEG